MEIEYYFCNEPINENAWISFSKYYNDVYNRLSNQTFSLITDYGWKSTFALNPDGKALYIDESGKVYNGYWFILNSEKRVAIFSNK